MTTTTFSMSFMWVAFVPLMLPVLCLIIVILKPGPHAGKLMGISCILGGAMFVFLSFFGAIAMPRMTQLVPLVESPRQVGLAPVLPAVPQILAQAVPVAGVERIEVEPSFAAASNSWPSELAEDYAPDVYSSPASATVGATAALARWLGASLEGKEPPAVIRVGGTIGDALLQRIIDRLGNAFPKARVMEAANPATNPSRPDDLLVWASFTTDAAGALPAQENSPSAQDDARANARANAQVVLLKAEGKDLFASARAAFIDKPWVADFPRFASTRSEHPWIVGYSQAAALSAAEAEAGAAEGAARQFHAMVLGQVARPGQVDQRAANALLDRIRADFRSGHSRINDRFTQSNLRPIGTVWRAAMLVDANPQGGYIDALREVYQSAAQAQQVKMVRGSFSVVVLALVIVGVYLFLNIMTKGYFTGPLRVAAVVALGLGVTLIVLLVA